MQRIQKVKKQDLDSKEYKNRKLIYILNKLAKEFIKDFYQGITQGYNKVTALINRLQEKYIIYKIQKMVR